MTLDDPVALAREILVKVEYPSHVLDELPAKLKDVVAVTVGVGTRAQRVQANPVTAEIRAMPSSLRPSWENTLVRVLEERVPKAPLQAGRAAKHTSHAADWPEPPRRQPGLALLRRRCCAS
ncbi:MAG: hypothetical protein JNK82_22715 [Myxococcaceae bacterium]|nr:hypothetical protein [Myxococcaceae bacterium]